MVGGGGKTLRPLWFTTLTVPPESAAPPSLSKPGDKAF